LLYPQFFRELQSDLKDSELPHDSIYR
jgi:hypothetical protein